MFGSVRRHLQQQLDEIHASGLYKTERIITTPQGPRVGVQEGKTVLNSCANNYLGLASEPDLIAAAHQTLDRWGYGLSSVRFICGTQVIHKRLEDSLAEFLGTEDTILYTSCFDANTGLFEALLDVEDTVISDQLNHASIIDGIRLCKAERLRYAHNDINDLEKKLQEASGARFRLIATDGVFSMDGTVADLPRICELAEKYDSLVMVDDSHGVGVLGAGGRGTHEHHNAMSRVDLITGTLGKALGGASGGYTSGRREIVEVLRQRSRPYLFSNTLAPPIVGASLKALELLSRSTEARERLMQNTRVFRTGMRERGFDIPPGGHPIVPIMLGDAVLAQEMSSRLLDQGIYVIAFSYPVVPKGQARIRVQVSAAHSQEDLEFAMEAFSRVKQAIGR
jgi:glycine C-acetyltransferase